MNMYSPVTREVIFNLAQFVGTGNLSTRKSELDLHAQAQSTHEAHLPAVIKVKCNDILGTTPRPNVFLKHGYTNYSQFKSLPINLTETILCYAIHLPAF
jgi:hypothetical protein